MSNSVSIIIPTFNGANRLPVLLKSLEKQSYTEFEVIIILDGSTDNTKPILKKMNLSFPLKLYEQSNKGRSIARNNGAKNANTGLLLFLDDDMEVKPDCIKKHKIHHNERDGSILTGAQIQNRLKLKNDIQRFKSYIETRWVAPLKHQVPLKKEILYLTAANLSLHKNTFERLEGFDERLTDAEDFDLAVRAWHKNIPIYYNHDAFAWHNDFVDCRSYILRQRTYKQAHQKLRELKPELYKEFPRGQAPPVSGVKKWIFNFFAHRFWVNIIDRFNILPFILPPFIRFKIYTFVIWGLAVHFPNRKL